MRDQTEFLPLGPPLRITEARAPIDMAKLEAAEFEMYDASHEAPDAVWNGSKWVHHNEMVLSQLQAEQATAGGYLRQGNRISTPSRAEMEAASRIDAAKALNRIQAAEYAANPPQAQSPELAAAIEGAQRAMLAHFFGDAERAQVEEKRGATATGMMLMQEQANRNLRKTLMSESIRPLKAPWRNSKWEEDSGPKLGDPDPRSHEEQARALGLD
jgi:hypothetical protein